MTSSRAATEQSVVAPGRLGRGVSASGLLLAILAVASVSTSAVLIRLAGSVSAFEIAMWRLVVASAVLAPPMVSAGDWPAVRRAGWRRFALYGLILAAHFITYNLALRYTPIAHVLPLLYTSTVITAVLSALVLHEPLRRRQQTGIAVVLCGIFVLAGFTPHFSARVLLGDALALVSAIAFALYALVGRGERVRLPLLGYAVGVYAAAAIWTLPLAVAFTHGGYTWTVAAALIGLGLIPNAVGHTLFNASLRRLNATIANVLFTQEITGGIILGWLVLGEQPAANAVAGAAIMLIGIIVVLL